MKSKVGDMSSKAANLPSVVGNNYETLSSKVEDRLNSDTLFGWLLDGKYVGSKSSPVGGKGIILVIGIAAAVLMAAAQWMIMRKEYDTANILQILAYCCWVLYFLFNILKGTPSLQIECSLTMKMLACLNVLIFAVFNRVSNPLPNEMPKTLLLAASLTFLVSTLYSPKNHIESFALSGTLLLVSSAFAAVMEKGGEKSYDLTSNVVAMIYLAISCWAAFKVEQKKGGEVWISKAEKFMTEKQRNREISKDVLRQLKEEIREGEARKREEEARKREEEATISYVRKMGPRQDFSKKKGEGF